MTLSALPGNLPCLKGCFHTEMQDWAHRNNTCFVPQTKGLVALVSCSTQLHTQILSPSALGLSAALIPNGRYIIEIGVSNNCLSFFFLIQSC